MTNNWKCPYCGTIFEKLPVFEMMEKSVRGGVSVSLGSPANCPACHHELDFTLLMTGKYDVDDKMGSTIIIKSVPGPDFEDAVTGNALNVEWDNDIPKFIYDLHCRCGDHYTNVKYFRRTFKLATYDIIECQCLGCKARVFFSFKPAKIHQSVNELIQQNIRYVRLAPGTADKTTNINDNKSNTQSSRCPRCGSGSIVLLAKTDFGDRYHCTECDNHFSTTKTEGWRELNRPDFGFKISYPSNWIVQYTSACAIEICPSWNPHIFDPGLNREVASPGINITITSGRDPNENMVERFFGLRPRGYERYEFTKRYDHKVQNADFSVFYEFQYGNPDHRFCAMSLIAQKKSQMFTITASGIYSDLSSFRKMIEAILLSFQLL